MFGNKENRNRCGCYGEEENNGFFGMEEAGQGFGEGFGQGFGNGFDEEGQEAEFGGQGFGGQGFGGQGFGGQGQGQGQEAGLPRPGGCPQGQTRRYTSNTNVNGRTCNINNRYYYDNYYNRYNRYYVNDVNYVKRFVRDINVWYYSTRTVDCGTQYLGATNVNGGCQGGGAGAPGNGCGHGCGCQEDLGC